ncbi:MAG: hypothetical protein RMI43_00425 [Candidatus Caldarchaeum sp.]|nr:RsmD family RNA methyltransferase [Candidatus Caldarchaeum sp.]MDW8062618.1 hypothetical protein [Candidatus Caldarchaeum sp.]MDW8435557.1 hypothetical protein [Candidatus Caldarchaeum sp.]
MLDLQPVNAPLLSGYEARHLLSGEAVDVSLDLGVSTEPLRSTADGIYFAGKMVSWNTLSEISRKPEDVYVFEERFRKLAWFDKSFYRLVVPGLRIPPTLEINGIRMHRTVGITPLQDAQTKVALFPDLSGAKVLDICTGLGYTASALMAKGAAEVVTVEKDLNVLKMAAFNPWSRPLFAEGIKTVLEDAVVFLQKCGEVFDAVMHDPPTVKTAGELYSSDFYRLVWKVLKRDGIFVHYVGQPGIRRGMLFYRGVVRRLREVGFKPFFVHEALCVKALKV